MTQFDLYSLKAFLMGVLLTAVFMRNKKNDAVKEIKFLKDIKK